MPESPADRDGFTEHYLQELEALRREGREFAERYPKVAARLKIEDAPSPDPHVERLLEGIAFLAARLRRKLDDEFPELSDALLEVLYPHLARPIPAITMAELELDPEQSVPTDGKRIPRGTTFLTRPVRGEPLRFRTSAPLTLWPIRVAEAQVTSPDARDVERHPRARSVLRIRLVAEGEHPFGALELESLRFFLRGEAAVVDDLYELLCIDALEARLETAEGARRGVLALPDNPFRACGFSEDEALLPYPHRSFSGYRLLQEYFAFPAKFQFVELGHLASLRGSKARSVDIRVVLRREPRVTQSAVSHENFSLRCVPLVNLFEATADPILLGPYRSEHDVVPDAQRPLDLEVYSVEEVEGVNGSTGARTRYAPFYSVSHDAAEGETPPFWHTRRRASRKKGDEGTEVSLALVDLDLQRCAGRDELLHVRILCTNRDLAADVAQWGRSDDLRPEGLTGIRSTRCVQRPTRPLRPGLSGAGHWRLLAQLSLNYLSLVSEGRDALREILRIYDISSSPANREQIEGILDVRSEPSVRWVRGAGGSGFCRGTCTTIVLDRDRYVGASPLLFASVLERFLALYCGVNSFSEMALETTQERAEIFRWSPRAGEQALL